MAEPTLPTFTAMKNEGPFILEWVARWLLKCVRRVVVPSNGRDARLDQPERTGRVHHRTSRRRAADG